MDVKVLLGLKRFDVLGLAETFLKEECDRVKWYGRNRDGKRASGGVAELVHRHFELRVTKSREGWCGLS